MANGALLRRIRAGSEVRLLKYFKRSVVGKKSRKICHLQSEYCHLMAAESL